MVDPEIWLPGIYIARVVATLSNDGNNEISTGAHGSPRWSEVSLGSKSAEQFNSPGGKCDKLRISQEKAGSGGCQPESPPNRIRGVAVDSLSDYRGKRVSVSSETGSVTILTQRYKI
jgi:hypothetical protein